MQPSEFVEHLGAHRAVAILRTHASDAVAPAMEAAIRGGFEIVELTLNTPNAFEHIRELARRTDIVVGAGTVLTIDEARAAVDAGARFLVSPVTDAAIIEEAHRLEVAVMPGTFTATEVYAAHRAGAQLQKLFPAPGNGPTYVRALLGPLPFARIVPTSGVNADNAAAFLEAGAHAVGFVGPLFDPDDLEAGRFDSIEKRARALLAAVARADRT